uniref:CUB domain-containing protein n=1 Tax=Anopheles farauti TaxID=69004 RepID=A0A182Q2J3_9DIPT
MYCGGHATIRLNSTDTAFNFSSPGYPNGYTNGLNCSWVFQSALSGYHPYLSFDFIDLEETGDCLADFVEVFTSADLASWKSHGRICTYGIRVPRTFDGTPYLKVEFRTDYYQNRTGFSGAVMLRCGGLLTDPNGVITQPKSLDPLLPGTPFGRRDQFEECNWNISVRAGRTIEFTFEHINIIGFKSAGFVAVMNGIDNDSPLLGRYNGTELPSAFGTGSNRAFVQYVPSRTGANRFRLAYREVGIECGGDIVLNAQYKPTVITTPNYPEIPPPHTECIWKVLAPAGQVLWVEFLDQNYLPRSAQCKTEYVQLREGLTSNAPELMHSCTSDLSKRIVTSSNAVSVKYFNDNIDRTSGIK